MKNALIILLLFICLNANSKTIIVQANYIGFNNKQINKQWRIEIKNNLLLFFLDKKLKAKLFLVNGKTIRIEEYKTVAGKEKTFIITKQPLIKLEIDSQFYPFSFVLDYLYNKTQNKNSNIFKVKEVKEQ